MPDWKEMQAQRAQAQVIVHCQLKWSLISVQNESELKNNTHALLLPSYCPSLSRPCSCSAMLSKGVSMAGGVGQ